MLRQCLLIASLLLPCCAHAEDITIVLKDGRVISGQVDSDRTDPQRLWIRQMTSSLSVSSAFKWSSIARIPEFTTEQSQHLALATHSEPSRIVVTPTFHPVAHFPQARAPATPRIRTIAFESTLSNWDRDPDVDGIQLTIFPLDAKRRVVASEGAVYATLLSRTPEPLPKVVPVEVWSEKVGSDLAGSDAIVVKLPFRNLRNGAERFYRANGLLKVRLSVRGQGSFQAEGIVPLSEF